MSDPQFGRFFLPGLCEVHPRVLEKTAQPMMPHRGQAASALLRRLNEGLQKVFRTKERVMIGTCTATAFMEMAVRSGVRRRSLALIGGTYGERFAGLAESTGREVVRLNVPEGRTVEPDMLEDALRRTKVDAVTMVHSETSTGAQAPLEELAEVVRSFDDVMFLVDGVTSVGASPVETDSWGLDFVFCGSYGALGLPPGLSLAVCSEQFAERARALPERGACLDVLAHLEAASSFQPTHTPALPLLYALEDQLERIEAGGGISSRWEQHAAMRAAVEEWVETTGGELGFSCLPEMGRRSCAVSCLRVPVGEHGRTVAKALEKEGWSIGSGYGKLKQETIRIGHIGDHSVEELEGLLDALGNLVARPQPE